MLYSLPVVAGTGRVHGSTVRLFSIGSFCDFFLCGVLATMQDEFTLARNPQPLTGIKDKTSSVSEQKHHHPGHRRKFYADPLNSFSMGFAVVIGHQLLW